MKRFIVMIMFCGIIHTSISQEKALFRSVSRYMESAVEDGLSGVVIYIDHPKKGSWTGSAGYADKSKGIKMQSSNVVALASVSKVYAAMAVFKLIDDGQLNLDDKIADYLPEKVIKGLDNGAEITIKHLLNHTSGLINYEWDSTLNSLYLSDRLSLDTLSHLETLERYVFGKGSLNRPGEEHHYSSTGYKLLAMIMDQVVIEGHTNYIRGLLKDMGATNTFYRESPPENSVRYYGDFDKDGKQDDITDKVLETTNWFIGDDGLYATAQEVGEFMRRLITGKILTQEGLDNMMLWNDDKKPDYGQGLFADKAFPYKYTVGHSGRGIGSTTDVYYFPVQGITVAILSNTGLRSASKDFSKAYFKLRNRVIKKLFLF